MKEKITDNRVNNLKNEIKYLKRKIDELEDKKN